MSQKIWSPFEAHVARYEPHAKEYLAWLRSNNSSLWVVKHVRKRLVDEVPREWLEARVQNWYLLWESGEFRNSDQAFVETLNKFRNEALHKKDGVFHDLPTDIAFITDEVAIYITVAAIRVRRSWVRTARKRGFSR